MRVRSRVHRWLFVACLPLVLAVHCTNALRTSMTVGDTSIERVELEMAGPLDGVALLRGDFVLRGGGVRAVVGGLLRKGDAQGALLEARTEDGVLADSPRLVAPVLVDGGRRHEIRFTRAFVIERNGRPILRFEGSAAIGEKELPVHREVSLGRAGSAVSLVTRVDMRGADANAATLVTRASTPHVWVPGVDSVASRASFVSASFAAEAPSMSYVVGAREGELSMAPLTEVRGDTIFLRGVEIREPVRDGAVATSHLVVALSPDDVAGAYRRWGWARGTAFPEARATLPYAPAGARAEIVDADGSVWMRGAPSEAGEVVLPVLRAELREAQLVAKAFGHADSDPVSVASALGAGRALEIPRGGRIRIAVRDANGDATLRARVRIVAVSPTIPLALGPDSSATGAIDTVIAKEDVLIVSAPPGTYDVIVTRGPEWSRFEQRVTVTESFRPDVRAALRHEVDSSGWTSCDFHVHAEPSPDSDVTLEDRLLSLDAEGVLCAMPTDHDTITDYAAALETTNLAGFFTLPGVEVTTWDPVWGHFNGLGVRPVAGAERNGAPPFLATTPSAIFAAIRALDPDALVQVNHPRLEGEIGYFDRTFADPAAGTFGPDYDANYDLLEVWNGFDLAREPAMLKVFGDWLELVARGYRHVATGSSDSHRIRYQWAGYPRTVVRVSENASARDVLSSLREGRAFVTSGPFVGVSVAGKGLGDTVTVEGHEASVRVRVQTPSWMHVDELRVYVGNQLVLTEPLRRPAATRRNPSPPTSIERELSVTFERDAPLVVVVRGDEVMDLQFARNGIHPFAFTNPIWIDADGDGASLRDPRLPIE